ncbi:MAG: DNA repair protein RecO [Clostridia bacterium]
MEILEVDALCLRVADYKDNDKLLTLYGTEKGKFLAVARGCKKSNAKLKYAASPLCFGHYYFSAANDRYTLTGCDCYDSFFALTQDIDKFYCAMTILEFLDKASVENEFNKDLFVISVDFLRKLAYETLDCKLELFNYFRRAMILLGFKCNAIKLKDYYNFFANNLDITLNSLKFFFAG